VSEAPEHLPRESRHLFVTVDASTTSVRSIIFDTTGSSLAAGRASLTYERIGRDGYEQDALSWWTAVCESIREALSKLPQERHADLVSLCIAHQRETIVPTDAKGEPLAKALLWMDSRCKDDVTLAERNVGSVRLHAVSGKPACTTPSLYKLMYLFRTRPELRDIAFVHDVHSFLSLRLTGRSVSAFPSADPTGLVDMRKKAWSRSLTSLVGVDPHQLPELVECGYLIGPLTPAAAEATGLPESVLLYAGSGDGQLAGLGAGVIEKGQGFLDIGTAISCGVITDRYEIDTAFRTLYSAMPGRYCLETTLRGGMLTLWWLVEGLLGSKTRLETMFELEAEAGTINAGAEGLVAIPYWAGVMNPYWDDGARGSFIGLHPSHRPAHLYRALLEGIALEQRLHLEGVAQAIGKSNRDLVVLGGGSRSDIWCQILADVLGRPIHRCRTADAASLGAAVLSSVAHGVHPSFERATEKMTRLGARFEPGVNSLFYERLYRDVYRGLYVDIQARMRSLAYLRDLTTTDGVQSVPPPASKHLER
jgi:xylulokinase